MNVQVPAYVAENPEAFGQHQTVFLKFNKTVDIELNTYLEHRHGFENLPDLPRLRHIDITGLKRNTSVSGYDRADLIITNDPQEIFGYIHDRFVQQTFKLSELQELAMTLWGQELASWQDVFKLSRADKAKLFTQPLVRQCQRERKSEQQMLGYKLVSWEDFHTQYDFIVQEGRETQVYVFPKGTYNMLAFSAHQIDFTEPDLTASFYENSAGEPMCWLSEWGWANSQIFIDEKMPGKVLRGDDYRTLTAAIQRIVSAYRLYVKFIPPRLDFYDAPTLFNGVKYVHYLPEAKFDLPQLQALAKDLGIKGYSNRTKAELSIILGEELSKMEPAQQTPALVQTNLQGSGMPEDVETIGYDHPLVQQAKGLTPREYYEYATRVVSNAAFAPHSPGSPAGRIPTDGNFPAYYGLAPIDILSQAPEEELVTP